MTFKVTSEGMLIGNRPILDWHAGELENERDEGVWRAGMRNDGNCTHDHDSGNHCDEGRLIALKTLYA